MSECEGGVRMSVREYECECESASEDECDCECVPVSQGRPGVSEEKIH